LLKWADAGLALKFALPMLGAVFQTIIPATGTKNGGTLKC
jgi:hypothetical protein